MYVCVWLHAFISLLFWNISDNSRSTGRGYQRLCQKDADTDRKSETEQSTEDSEDSNLEDGSDSEFGKYQFILTPSTTTTTTRNKRIYNR